MLRPCNLLVLYYSICRLQRDLNGNHKPFDLILTNNLHVQYFTGNNICINIHLTFVGNSFSII